mgnify:CR=1 FL=1
MKLFDTIKHLLITDAYLRNSDKKLQWEVWKYQGAVHNGVIDYATFMSRELVSPETIRRTRQKIQEKYPELRAIGAVLEEREKKRKTKSTFVYREPIKVLQFVGNVAYVE